KVLQLHRYQGDTSAGTQRATRTAGSTRAAILHQHDIYPPATFTEVQKYGLTLLVTTDPELIKYLNNVVEQLKGNIMSRKDIHEEICSVIRKIIPTMTFLPLLIVSCSFDLLVYTDKDLIFITSSEEVGLLSFTATIHKVDSLVTKKSFVND
uniref:Uncharacterized protein n=1 Tax=Castor canadensis TaxID=51338 RepID=A0A8C0W169_CASCN